MNEAHEASPARRLIPPLKLGGPGRVWLLSILLAGTAALLYFGFVVHLPAPDAPFPVPWVVLAAMFGSTSTGTSPWISRFVRAISAPTSELQLFGK